MKSIIIALVIFAGAALAADEATERAAIENTIRAFTVMPNRGDLYTSDFDNEELVRFGKAENASIPIKIDGAEGTLVISKEPMGEAVWLPAGMHSPMLIRKIRFVTDDVAMVDAVAKDPVLIVMRKVGTNWKIASLRILAPTPSVTAP
jgi:hypothetical protein